MKRYIVQVFLQTADIYASADEVARVRAASLEAIRVRFLQSHPNAATLYIYRDTKAAEFLGVFPGAKLEREGAADRSKTWDEHYASNQDEENVYIPAHLDMRYADGNGGLFAI